MRITTERCDRHSHFFRVWLLHAVGEWDFPHAPRHCGTVHGGWPAAGHSQLHKHSSSGTRLGYIMAARLIRGAVLACTAEDQVPQLGDTPRGAEPRGLCCEAALHRRWLARPPRAGGTGHRRERTHDSNAALEARSRALRHLGFSQRDRARAASMGSHKGTCVV